MPDHLKPAMPGRVSGRLKLAVTALGLSALATAAGLTPITTPAPAQAAPTKPAPEVAPDTYRGQVQVVRGAAADEKKLLGSVFDDKNKNSVQDKGEKGIPGVSVSNGREVVTTDGDGRYAVAAYDNMTVFATQPSGWQVPVDESQFAQFSYNHLPAGSPKLKYGGIAPTGPLPQAVNFPMARSKATANARQSCPIASDTQAYDMTEMGYARDGAVADLVNRKDYGGCGILMLGDNVGDDLSLYPALKDIYAKTNGPIRAAMGNHDMDYDAPDPSHSLDTFRQHIGPAYFSYDVGNSHVVVLDSIEFPLVPGQRKYKEHIDAEQLDWLKKDLANVPMNRPVVLATHAPIVDHRMKVVDNATDLYEILAGRTAVTVGGHTHTLENLRAGDRRAEWAKAGIDELPVTQLVAGAVSGNWYSGGLDEQGLPYAFMTDGARPGIMTLDLDGSTIKERYTIRGESDDKQLALGVNTPSWRDWAARAKAWQDSKKAGEMPALADERQVSAADLASGKSWLTADFYPGSSASRVEVAIDGGAPKVAEHTQPGRGEELKKGWEYSDPFAATRNLQTSGGVTQASPHLWRLPLPTDLTAGTHTAKVTGTDTYGREFTETIRFTVGR